MKGLLCYEGTEDDLLVFLCEVCNQEHAIFVNKNGPHIIHLEKNGWKNEINVWGYRFSNKGTVLINPTMFCVHGNADIYPSFNNFKWCGLHTGGEWEVQCLVLEKGMSRNEKTEEWLRN